MYLVFDIGGTKMRFATSVDGKTLSAQKTIPTENDFDKALLAIKQVTDELTKGEKITAAAGGAAGPLDKDKTMLIASPHISGWINKPLKKSLEDLFKVPVILEHDADLSALAEARFGAGKEYKIVANLNIGTGVASSRIVDNKIDVNSLGFEAGHQIIVIDGNKCDCGGRGHLEAYVGGSAIARYYGLKGEEIKDNEFWNKVAKFLAVGVYNTIVFWSPDVVVLGGNVMKSIPLERVKEHLADILKIFPKSPEILSSKLDDSAVLLEALFLSSKVSQ